MTGNLAVVHKLYEAFAAKDEAVLRKVLHPDVEWVQCEGFPGGGHHRGVEEVLHNVFRALRNDWTEWRVEIDEYLDAGPSVVVLGRYVGTHGVTHRSMSAVFAHVYDLENERIVRFRQFTDTVPLVNAARA